MSVFVVLVALFCGTVSEVSACMPARPRGCCMDHNGSTTHFAGWLCTPRSSLRLAGARSSPDRAENAYTMLGVDPGAGHKGLAAA